MTTDNKTLAGVQPGGRVRLGDQAELDRLEFQAWARELLPCPFCGNSAEFVPYKDNGLTLKCKSMGCIQRNQRTLRYGIDWLRTSMAEHWNTRALSAQPSPGGQGDARRQWLEIRGLAAAIVKNLQAFADAPHKAAWCGALDDSLLFADQIEKAAAAAYEADLERRRMA
ncbi:Lar family restriction alleviation protein [Stenotrophomonas maltophilia]|nr:Lar family restriction alleviation protein [Stenotrophomonas maltophilia]